MEWIMLDFCEWFGGKKRKEISDRLNSSKTKREQRLYCQKNGLRIDFIEILKLFILVEEKVYSYIQSTHQDLYIYIYNIQINPSLNFKVWGGIMSFIVLFKYLLPELCSQEVYSIV